MSLDQYTLIIYTHWSYIASSVSRVHLYSGRSWYLGWQTWNDTGHQVTLVWSHSPHSVGQESGICFGRWLAVVIGQVSLSHAVPGWWVVSVLCDLGMDLEKELWSLCNSCREVALGTHSVRQTRRSEVQRLWGWGPVILILWPFSPWFTRDVCVRSNGVVEPIATSLPFSFAPAASWSTQAGRVSSIHRFWDENWRPRPHSVDLWARPGWELPCSRLMDPLQSVPSKITYLF